MPIPLTIVMRGIVRHINGPHRCGTIVGEDGVHRLFSFSSVVGGGSLRKRQPVEFEHFELGMREGELPRAVRIRAI